MKKTIYKATVSVVLLFLLGFILMGCSQTHLSFDIGAASKIDLCLEDQGTSVKTVEITDTDSIQYITENINALKFGRSESNRNNFGARSYSLSWYDSNDNLMEEIMVLNEYHIKYKGDLFSGMDVDYEIDTSFFDSLLSD